MTLKTLETRNAAFVSLIPSKVFLPALPQAVPEFRGDATGREKCSVRDLSELDIYKFIDQNEMHLRMLSELINDHCLFWWWWGPQWPERPKKYIHPKTGKEEDPGKHSSAILTSGPAKMIELLGVTPDAWVTREWLKKGSINLPLANHCWSAWVSSGIKWLPLKMKGKQWMSYTLTVFSKDFNMVLHHILVAQLWAYGLDEWNTRWVKNCLHHHFEDWST